MEDRVREIEGNCRELKEKNIINRMEKEFKQQKTAILLLPLSKGSERNIEI